MTKLIYDVVSSPKNNESGRTDIGWKEECGRDAVPLGGYLITNRTPRGEKKSYIAMVCMAKEDTTGQDVVVDTMIGFDYETRAKAAFAIWREYYKDWRDVRITQRAEDERLRKKKIGELKQERLNTRDERNRAYHDEFNKKRREARAARSPLQIDADNAKRRHQRGKLKLQRCIQIEYSGA